MKNILTHIAAFIIGLLILPLLLTITVKTFPKAIPDLIVKIASHEVNDHGVAALNKAKTEKDRFYHLGRAAKQLFNEGNIQEAKKCAQELISLTPKYKGNWNYGNAIQDSNVVLGKIAIQEGDIDAAKSYLLAASKSPGSPQMNSFGPNVSLARDLLLKGEKDAVIDYFTSCKAFWKLDNGRLDDWIASAKAGNIPAFQANLIY